MSRFAGSILLSYITRSMITKENAMSHKPTRGKYAILKQLCELIPPYLVPKLAREHGVRTSAASPNRRAPSRLGRTSSPCSTPNWPMH